LDIGSWLLPIREDFHPDLPSIQGRDGQPRFSLNTICSAEGLLKFYREARRIHGEAEDLPESFGFAELCECFQEGEASAIDAVEVAARALGRVVARADDILNFDRIILDGLFQEMGDDFTRRVSRHFREFSMRYEEAREENGKIIFSQLGDRAAAIGAAGQLLSYYESASSVKTESASSPA
jgi:predicted NBD/HSP70 family sugar kinase